MKTFYTVEELIVELLKYNRKADVRIRQGDLDLGFIIRYDEGQDTLREKCTEVLFKIDIFNQLQKRELPKTREALVELIGDFGSCYISCISNKQVSDWLREHDY